MKPVLRQELDVIFQIMHLHDMDLISIDDCIQNQLHAMNKTIHKATIGGWLVTHPSPSHGCFFYVKDHFKI